MLVAILCVMLENIHRFKGREFVNEIRIKSNTETNMLL